MAALAALYDQPAVAAGEIDDLDGGRPLGDPRGWQEVIDRHNLELGRRREIPDSVRLLVEELADQVAAIPEDATLRVDPYLVLAAQRALIGALRTLASDDAAWARTQMRVHLEQIRQVYRDVGEAGPLYADRPTKEIVRWLASVVDVPHARLADLFGISTRTFQRWVSDSDRVAPEGDDARRLRVVAGVVNHLRHAVTGPGAIAWFERPHPRLDGTRPADLLDDLQAPARLTALAASTRSNTAT